MFIQRAEILSFRKIDDWTHGFYPFGYPLLLKLVAYCTNDYETAGKLISVLSALLAMIFTAKIGSLLVRSGSVAPLSVLFLALTPNFLTWATSSGTDMLSVGITLCVIFYSLTLCYNGSRSRLFLVGMWTGVAYLIRYNNLVLLPVLAIWVIVLHYRSSLIKEISLMIVILALGFLSVAFPQLLISYLVHGNPFWNLQAQNVYFGIYGAANWGSNWAEASKIQSLSEVIQKDWIAFLKNWLSNLCTSITLDLIPWPLNLLSLGGLILSTTQLDAKKHLFMYCVIAAYVFSISLAYTNERYLLVLSPILALYAASFLVQVLDFPFLRSRWLKISTVSVVAIYVFNSGISNSLLSPLTEGDRTRLELSTFINTIGVQKASEVLSFSFDYYDLSKRTKDRYDTPWGSAGFHPYTSVQDIAARMRAAGQKILVFDSNSVNIVKGFSDIWPAGKSGFDQYFELVHVFNSHVYVYWLRN